MPEYRHWELNLFRTSCTMPETVIPLMELYICSLVLSTIYVVLVDNMHTVKGG